MNITKQAQTTITLNNVIIKDEIGPFNELLFYYKDKKVCTIEINNGGDNMYYTITLCVKLANPKYLDILSVAIQIKKEMEMTKTYTGIEISETVLTANKGQIAMLESL